MRNLLLAILLAVSIPLSSWAISLNEIQSAPEKYIQLSEDAENTFYLDANSITSIRYSPPYYTLQGEVYIVGYTRGLIAQHTMIFNYDYNRSFNSLMSEVIKTYPTYTNTQLLDMIEARMKNNSGILFSCNKIDYYHFDGQFIKSSNPNIQGYKILYASGFQHIANSMFKKYYDLEFIPGI